MVSGHNVLENVLRFEDHSPEPSLAATVEWQSTRHVVKRLHMAILPLAPDQDLTLGP